MNTAGSTVNTIDNAIRSGAYPVASIDMFDEIESLKMDSGLLLHLEYTQDLLNMYLEDVKSLEGFRPGMLEFLKAIRYADMIDNQGLEKQNMLMTLFYSQIPRETAMGRLIKLVKSEKQLTGRDLFSLNNTLLYGTLSEGDSAIRKSNSKFVGRFVNGERIVDYFPIDYKDVKVASVRMANLYNKRLSGELFDNVFFQPFLIHGLMGALQLFNDGNTRMARIMQHALIWQLINERMNYNFEMPPIYTTKSYYPHRVTYREKISHLVTSGDNEAWNDWFDFNLSMVDNTIDTIRTDIYTLKKTLK